MIDIWKSGKDIAKCSSCFEPAEYEVVVRQDGSVQENNAILCKNCLAELGFKVSDEVRKILRH